MSEATESFRLLAEVSKALGVSWSDRTEADRAQALHIINEMLRKVNNLGESL
jgi:hypothetical protein